MSIVHCVSQVSLQASLSANAGKNVMIQKYLISLDSDQWWTGWMLITTDRLLVVQSQSSHLLQDKPPMYYASECHLALSLPLSCISGISLSKPTAAKAQFKLTYELMEDAEDRLFPAVKSRLFTVTQTLLFPVLDEKSPRKAMESLTTCLREMRTAFLSGKSIPTTAPSAIPTSTSTNTKSTVLTEADIRLRSTLLAQRPDLLQLHHSLVIQQRLLTESQFWKPRQSLLDQLAADQNQQSGLPSSFLAQGQQLLQRQQLETAAGETVRLTMTPAMRHAILMQYPMLQEAYQENVPVKMTEQVFWTRYCQSRFFHRERHVAAPHDPLFDGLWLQQQQQLKGNVMTATPVPNPHLLPNVDLTAPDERPFAPITDEATDVNSRSISLRLNRHGAALVATKLIPLETQSDDLMQPNQLAFIPLTIREEARKGLDTRVKSVSERDLESIRAHLKSLVEWQPRLSQVPWSCSVSWMIQNLPLIESNKQQVIEEVPSALKQRHEETLELVRHIYTSKRPLPDQILLWRQHLQQWINEMRPDKRFMTTIQTAERALTLL